MPEQILSAETISPWWRRAVIITLLLSFAILIGISGTSYNAGPPIPKQVVSPSGETIFTGEDYESVLISAIEEKLKKHSKINLLYHLGKDCVGFDIEAMWGDTKIGIRHLTVWERIAVVTDIDWVRLATKAFGFAMPGHVKVFANGQLAEAREWVST